MSILETEQQAAAIAPLHSVFHDADASAPYVFVRDASGWKRREVSLGLANNIRRSGSIGFETSGNHRGGTSAGNGTERRARNSAPREFEMSKDLKPKQRIGQTAASRRKRMIVWTVLLLACAGGGYAAYRYNNVTKVEVPVAKARVGEFVVSVRTRGEVKSVKSVVIVAPQVPDPRIVRLAETGRPISRGDVVVEFDAAQQEQTYLERNTSVRTVEKEIVQTKASHRMTNESDSMSLMTSEYNVERAKLEASKAEVISEIEGAKNRIDVGISQGDLGQVKNHHLFPPGGPAGRPRTPRTEERTRPSATPIAPKATSARWSSALHSMAF